MGMDKEISPEVKRRRKKILIIKFAFVACALVCFFIVLVKVFSAGIPLEDIDFGTVTKGEIGISVSATGKVAPLSEEIITSPISSKILEVYKKSGEKLSKNDSILKLDLAEANVGMENQRDELEMKRFKLEDEDILVLNKPADMPVHPSIGNYTNTLANAAAFYFQQKNELCPFRCINRLDRDTSGSLILAKNALSAAILSAQMRNREIRRTYLAVVCGVTPPSGTVSAPIGRVSDSVIQRQVDPEHGESAVTHYERLAVRNDHSLLEIHLETGRTHQIRVHMGYIGHPLPADYLYHPVYDHFKRQPLHSFRLNFRHPLTGKNLCFTAPVPKDMAQAF